MSPILHLAKKELDRFLSIKASAAIAVFLPGLLIFLIYSFMGHFAADKAKVNDLDIATIGMPASLSTIVAQTEANLTNADRKDLPNLHQALESGDIDLIVSFPESFETDVVQKSATEQPLPCVDLYYDPSSIESTAALYAMNAALDGYEVSLSNRFDIDIQSEPTPHAEKAMVGNPIAANMVPVLILIMVLSGCLSIGAESIAGEKERGTIGMLLAAPISRTSIAIGKVASLSIVSLAIGISSAIGVFAGLSSAMQGIFDFSAYRTFDYLAFFCVIASVTTALVSAIAVISALGKTTKEAQVFLTPLMVVVMGIGLSSMLNAGAQESLGMHLIPLYGSVQCMISVLSLSATPAHVLACMAGNAALTCICIVALERMLGSERMMFAR